MMSKELFRQAKGFIATLPRATTPSNKPFSTSDAVAHAFVKMEEAWSVKNKRLAYQHVATAIDLIVNSIGLNKLNHELVFSQMKALTNIEDKEFLNAVAIETARNLEFLVNYGMNVNLAYVLSKKDKSMIEDMLKRRKKYEAMFTAQSVDSLIDLVACGGTYSRMRLMVHLQTYEREIANLHMAIFTSIDDDEDFEKATQEHGEHVTSLMKLVAKAAGDDTLTDIESYNATSYIRNSVSTMFSSLAIKDNALRSRDSLELMNYGGTPDYDIVEPIKSGKPNIFYLLNPLPTSDHLGAAVFEWGHLLEQHKPKTELTYVAPATIPSFVDDEQSDSDGGESINAQDAHSVIYAWVHNCKATNPKLFAIASKTFVDGKPEAKLYKVFELVHNMLFMRMIMQSSDPREDGMLDDVLKHIKLDGQDATKEQILYFTKFVIYIFTRVLSPLSEATVKARVATGGEVLSAIEDTVKQD